MMHTNKFKSYFKHINVKIAVMVYCLFLVSTIFNLNVTTAYAAASSNAISFSLSNTTVTHRWVDTSQYNSSADAISNSVTGSQTLYFASNGSDENSGLDPQHPKKNPTDCFRQGNNTILLKSGDIFTLNYNLAVGSNVKIATYGGVKRAVINWVPLNTAHFELYDISNNIYYAPLDNITDTHFKVSWLKISGSSSINWHKVFSYEDMVNTNDFYSDVADKILYIKSNNNLQGKSFAFASNAGGITIKDSSNCVLENLEIVGGGTGIVVNNSSNVVIRNCFIHHAGGIEAISKSDGNYYRYGNGITVWANNVHNIYIYNNYVSDCFDAGISPQISGTGSKPSDSIFIYNNLVDRCLYSIEFYEHNREKTIPLSNVYIQNNILTNAIDITDGYRYATYGYTGYFCAWSSLCDKSSYTISNNLGYGTQEYAFSFYEFTPKGVNKIFDNTLFVIGKSQINDCIKNPEYYDANSSQIIPLLTTSNTIKNKVSSASSSFNKTNLFFGYLDSCLR